GGYDFIATWNSLSPDFHHPVVNVSTHRGQGPTAPAFDTGRRGHVYGPGGSNEWIAVALLLLAGLCLATRPWLRRRPRVVEAVQHA
ncbi:hypothetical protein AB0J63_48660, partial [Streptosporangium canum]